MPSTDCVDLAPNDPFASSSDPSEGPDVNESRSLLVPVSHDDGAIESFSPSLDDVLPIASYEARRGEQWKLSLWCSVE